MVWWSSWGRRATVRACLALSAGAVLAVGLRFGAGHLAGFRPIDAGAVVVSPSPASSSAQPAQQVRFLISGSITGLYPGATLPLVVTIANPEAFAIRVTSITTSVGSPNAGCASSNLTVAPLVGSVTVPARGTSTVGLAASLGHDTPDACQGAVFPLQYSGVAVKA